MNPPHLDVVIKPSKTVVLTFNIVNYGDPTSVLAKIRPFEGKDIQGGIRIKDDFEGPIRFSLNNADIALEQPFFMKTKDSVQLVLQVRVPENTPEGDYYYVVMAQTQPQPGAQSDVSPQSRITIAAPLLLTVTQSGIIDVKGKIALFDVIAPIHFQLGGQQYRIFDSSDTIPVSLIIGNIGNNVIQPEGQIKLRGNFGETAQYNIIPRNILSQSQRLAEATPSASLNCVNNANALCASPVSLLIPGFFVGSYHVDASIDFGDGTPSLFASTSFLALPLKFIGLVIGVIMISILLIKKIKLPSDEEL